jgi:hypothetical protein
MKIKTKWRILYEMALDKVGIKKLGRIKKHRYPIMLRDGCKCKNCGAEEDLTLDHIIPKSRGGNSHPSNMQVLCRACNQKKGHLLPNYAEAPVDTVSELLQDLVRFIKDSDLPVEKLTDKAKDKIYNILFRGAHRSQFPLYHKKQQLLNKLANPPEGTSKKEIELAIRKTNFKIKRINEFANRCKELHEYRELKKFVRNNFGDAAMKQFYSNINTIDEVQKRENPL